jgi:hypothetical protein
MALIYVLILQVVLILQAQVKLHFAMVTHVLLILIAFLDTAILIMELLDVPRSHVQRMY